MEVSKESNIQDELEVDSIPSSHNEINHMYDN